MGTLNTNLFFYHYYTQKIEKIDLLLSRHSVFKQIGRTSIFIHFMFYMI